MISRTLKSYWLTLGQFFTPFYTSTMKCDTFLHILRFLHFCDNMNKPDLNDNYYGRLWKMRITYDQLNYAHVKFQSPSEHLAVDKIIVLFK